jgi:hypothetical protein
MQHELVAAAIGENWAVALSCADRIRELVRAIIAAAASLRVLERTLEQTASTEVHEQGATFPSTRKHQVQILNLVCAPLNQWTWLVDLCAMVPSISLDYAWVVAADMSSEDNRRTSAMRTMMQSHCQHLFGRRPSQPPTSPASFTT